MEIPKREEYENEIHRLNGLINKQQDEIVYWSNKQSNDMQSRCAGMDNWCGGMTCCDRWKMDATKANNEQIKNGQEGLEKAKASSKNGNVYNHIPFI